LDIGAAPGSWSQYASKIVKNGKVISIDLKEMKEIDNTIQIKGDFTNSIIQNKIKNFLNKGLDVIISDMAVNTTGIKNIDSIQTPKRVKKLCFFFGCLEGMFF
jgi:23S rRNA methylase